MYHIDILIYITELPSTYRHMNRTELWAPQTSLNPESSWIFKARCHCLRPYVPTYLPDLWTVRWLVVDSPRKRMSQVLWLSNMSWHLNCVYDGHRCQGTTPKFHCLLPLTRHGASTGWWTWGNVRGNKWQPASDAQASSFEAFQFGCCPLKHGPMGGVNLRVWGTGAGEVITPQSRLTATTPRSHKTTWWHSLTGASQSHKAATKTQNAVEFEYTKGTVDMLLTTTLLQHQKWRQDV